MKIRLLVVDDQKVLSNSLCVAASKQRDIRIVGEACTGQDAVRLALRLKPDVVLMDIGMDGLDGMEATREILVRLPSTRVVVLSVFFDRQIVGEMLRIGVSGYLVKEEPLLVVFKAIRMAFVGKKYLSEKITGIAVCGPTEALSRTSLVPPSVLTQRQLDVLRLMAEGGSCREVSRSMGLSYKTIDAHKHAIMRKLKIDTIAGLVKYAVLHRIVSL